MGLLMGASTKAVGIGGVRLSLSASKYAWYSPWSFSCSCVQCYESMGEACGRGGARHGVWCEWEEIVEMAFGCKCTDTQIHAYTYLHI